MKTLSVFAVALHPEGVDRNPNLYNIPLDTEVALHPEGVDRNPPVPFTGDVYAGRPPPGGRG